MEDVTLQDKKELAPAILRRGEERGTKIREKERKRDEKTVATPYGEQKCGSEKGQAQIASYNEERKHPVPPSGRGR